MTVNTSTELPVIDNNITRYKRALSTTSSSLNTETVKETNEIESTHEQNENSTLPIADFILPNKTEKTVKKAPKKRKLSENKVSVKQQEQILELEKALSPAAEIFNDTNKFPL